jgi:hypothetical protein
MKGAGGVRRVRGREDSSGGKGVFGSGLPQWAMSLRARIWSLHIWRR